MVSPTLPILDKFSTFISMIRGHVRGRSWTKRVSKKGSVTSDLFSFGTQETQTEGFPGRHPLCKLRGEKGLTTPYLT